MNYVALPRRWTPLAVGNVRLWLCARFKRNVWTTDARATNISVSSDPIGCVDDLSGVTGNALQIVAGSRPTWSTSVFADGAISFDGVDDFLVGAANAFATSGSARSIFAAFKVASTTPISGLFTNRTSVRYHSMLTSAVYLSSNGADSATNVTTLISTAAEASKCTMAWIWNGSGLAPNVYLNGSPLTVNFGTQGSETGAAGYHVGKNAASQFFAGHLAELICFDGAASSTARTALLAYLKSANGTA